MDWGGIADATLRAFVGREAIIYALAAIGLNMHFGYTGLLNFGQVGFMTVGAYGVAISTLQWESWTGEPLPLGVAVLVGMLAAVLLALLLGLPTLRLRADYLAIVTIAASEILRFVIAAPTWRSVTGGSDGLNGFAAGFYDLNPIPSGRYGFGPWRYGSRELWVLTAGWILVLLATLLVWLLIRSPWGRIVKAIREDEDAVRSLGKNVVSYKMQSLIVGGVIGAFGGMILVLSQNTATPGSFVTVPTFFAYAALILGGIARTWGPVVGSALLWGILAFTQTLVNELVANDYIPSSVMDSTQAGNVRFILVGALLAALVVFRPQGIFGDRREIALGDR
ncbi:MAG TPA: branched-chain amino acid ABC transporter permease [Acidimicrobiales bacterium]